MAGKRKKKKKKLKIGVLKIVVLAVLFLTMAGGAFIFAVNAGWFGVLPDAKNLKEIKNESATLVFSADNKLLGKFFAENRTNIRYSQLPDHLIKALVATEDARYFLHDGIDSKSYLRVFIKTILMGDRSSGGGSTITQQLAKNLFGRPDFGLLTLPVNKVKEAIVASRLEKLYDKEEILLLYLNTVPFGENVFGIEAAANRYFNKTTANLSTDEAAVLIGLLKANTFYNPRLHPENALARRNLVLKLMFEQDYLSEKQLDQNLEEPLSLDYANYKAEGPANYFVSHVRKKASALIEEYNRSHLTAIDIEKDGLRIHTTLDLRLQKLTTEAIKAHLSQMQGRLDRELKDRKASFVRSSGEEPLAKRELFTWEGSTVDSISKSDSLWHYKKMLHAGVLSVNPESGAIKVWVGGNHYRYLPYDLVIAKRAAASAFKPILYTAALQKNYKPCTYLSNKQKVFEDFDGWEPKNYDQQSGGFVAMWYALSRSMNIPTVDLYFKTGHEQLDYLCRKLGFDRGVPDSPAAALGTLDVSLQELVRAYTAFANHGHIPQQYMIDRIEDKAGKVLYRHVKEKPDQVIADSIADVMTAMLERAAQQGTGKSLYTRFGLRTDWASKTGTSQEFRDARFMVYNHKLVTGVWVGAYDQAIHFRSGSNGSGATLALPVAGKLLAGVESDPQLHSYTGQFKYTIDNTKLMDCEGEIDNRSLKSVFNAVIGELGGKHKTDTIPDKRERPEKKKESKVKKFFKKLFGGGK